VEEEDMLEEASELQEEENEKEEGSRSRVLLEMEQLICRARKIVGNITTTGGKILLTALLGLTGNQ